MQFQVCCTLQIPITAAYGVWIPRGSSPRLLGTMVQYRVFRVVVLVIVLAPLLARYSIYPPASFLTNQTTCILRTSLTTKSGRCSAIVILDVPTLSQHWQELELPLLLMVWLPRVLR